jgi:hypothetical protein
MGFAGRDYTRLQTKWSAECGHDVPDRGVALRAVRRWPPRAAAGRNHDQRAAQRTAVRPGPSTNRSAGRTRVSRCADVATPRISPFAMGVISGSDSVLPTSPSRGEAIAQAAKSIVTVTTFQQPITLADIAIASPLHGLYSLRIKVSGWPNGFGHAPRHVIPACFRRESTG